jgi:hypothetical protein
MRRRLEAHDAATKTEVLPMATSLKIATAWPVFEADAAPAYEVIG